MSIVRKSMSIEGVNMSIVQRCMSIKEVDMSYELNRLEWKIEKSMSICF